jgi:hypothetical protein
MAPKKKATARKRTGGAAPKKKATARRQVAGTNRHPSLRLRPWNDQMKDEDIDNYNYVVFDEPELREYTWADGETKFQRFRIPVRNSRVSLPHDNLLGYIPLPKGYLPFWKQLCYTIVYYKVMHITIRKCGHPNQQAVQSARKSISSMLRYHLYCRGLIIEELFEQKGKEVFKLPIFDEYIIKDRFDLHWEEDGDFPRKAEALFGRSIFDKVVVKALGEWKSILILVIILSDSLFL